MAGGGGGGEKTEKATPKRRRDERKKGNVLMSQDVVAVVTLFASYVTMRIGLPMMADAMSALLRFCIDLAANLPTDGASPIGTELLTQSSMALARSVALPLLVTVLAAVIATFAQTKLLVSFSALQPKFSRLNPLEGIKKLFSLKSIIEAFKGVLKIAILLFIIYRFVKGAMLNFTQYMHTDLLGAIQSMLSLGLKLLLQVAVAFMVVSFFDYLYQWWEYERQLKMSKQEIKEEYKQTEGDPQIKGRIRELQRKMARSRMMQAVPEADVVIRNPTHFAVALRYRLGEDPAPIVVAKGQDELALRIVAKAEESGVAVVENKPLARALYASADIGQMIPAEQYGAVADVLVYIYKLNNKSPIG